MGLTAAKLGKVMRDRVTTTQLLPQQIGDATIVNTKWL